MSSKHPTRGEVKQFECRYGDLSYQTKTKADRFAGNYHGILPRFLGKIIHLLEMYDEEYHSQFIIALMAATSPMKDKLTDMIDKEEIEYDSTMTPCRMNVGIAKAYIKSNKLDNIVPTTILALGLELLQVADVEDYAELIAFLNVKYEEEEPSFVMESVSVDKATAKCSQDEPETDIYTDMI